MSFLSGEQRELIHRRTSRAFPLPCSLFPSSLLVVDGVDHQPQSADAAVIVFENEPLKIGELVVGAFLVVMIISNATGREDIEAYRGLAWRGAAVPAVCMAIFLFSLTGLPPFAGFVGKLLLFAAVIKGQFYILAVVAIMNSVISLYFYARIVKTMFLDTPTSEDGQVAMTVSVYPLLLLLAVPTVFFGIYWGPLLRYTNASISFFIK